MRNSRASIKYYPRVMSKDYQATDFRRLTDVRVLSIYSNARTFAANPPALPGTCSVYQAFYKQRTVVLPVKILTGSKDENKFFWDCVCRGLLSFVQLMSCVAGFHLSRRRSLLKGVRKALGRRTVCSFHVSLKESACWATRLLQISKAICVFWDAVK